MEALCSTSCIRAVSLERYSGDVSIAQVVVNLKAEVEKMREQVQNVE